MDDVGGRERRSEQDCEGPEIGKEERDTAGARDWRDVEFAGAVGVVHQTPARGQVPAEGRKEQRQEERGEGEESEGVHVVGLVSGGVGICHQ